MGNDKSATKLEREQKLEVPPGWSLPDLAAALPGAEVRKLPPLDLDTLYYDTSDFRLAQHRTALRYRTEQLAVRPATAPESTAVELGRMHAVVPPSLAKGGPNQQWGVKLPEQADGAVLARQEVTWAAQADERTGPGSSPVAKPFGPQALGDDACPGYLRAPEPPREARRFLTALSLGKPFQPVAHLKARRRRVQVLVGGRLVAEIDQDEVKGAALVLPRGRSACPPVVWQEVEVEAAEDADVSYLGQVVAALVANGARPSREKSKLATVLASAGWPSFGTTPNNASLNDLRPDATVADVLQTQAKACLEALVEHDPPIRLGDPDPEHVHKARVAARRFRSLLWALRRLPAELQDERRPPRPGTSAGEVAVDHASQDVLEVTTKIAERAVLSAASASWVSALSAELRWAGAALGTLRDADVRLAALTSQCAELRPPERALAAVVLEAARSDQAIAHQVLLDIMETERYLALLRSLEALGTGSGATLPEAPPQQLWEDLSIPAGKAMALLGASLWRSARRCAKRLGPAPSDEALHQVRIRAKRLRYVAEAAVPVTPEGSRRRAALRTARAATQLQDVLGELHDAVMQAQWLSQLAHKAPSPGESADAADVAFVAGKLAAALERRASAARSAWQRPWRSLNRKKLSRWTNSRAK